MNQAIQDGLRALTGAALTWFVAKVTQLFRQATRNARPKSVRITIRTFSRNRIKKLIQQITKHLIFSRIRCLIILVVESRASALEIRQKFLEQFKSWMCKSRKYGVLENRFLQAFDAHIKIVTR